MSELTQADLNELALSFLAKARAILLKVGGVSNMLMCTDRRDPEALVICDIGGAPRAVWPSLAHSLRLKHDTPWLVHVSEAWHSTNPAVALPENDPKRNEVIVVEATAAPDLLSIYTQRFTRPPTGGFAFDPPETLPTDNEHRYSYVFGIGSARRPVATGATRP